MGTAEEMIEKTDGEVARLEKDLLKEQNWSGNKARLRQMAARVGLADLDLADVVYELNEAGALLKTSGGYRITAPGF